MYFAALRREFGEELGPGSKRSRHPLECGEAKCAQLAGRGVDRGVCGVEPRRRDGSGRRRARAGRDFFPAKTREPRIEIEEQLKNLQIHQLRSVFFSPFGRHRRRNEVRQPPPLFDNRREENLLHVACPLPVPQGFGDP